MTKCSTNDATIPNGKTEKYLIAKVQKFVFVSETCSFVGEVVVESQCRIIEAIATMLIVGRFSIRRFRFLKTTNQGNYERTDLSF